jgi:hypothetical protein
MNPAVWLRIAAVAIAVAGVIDPVVTADRAVKRTVAVVRAAEGTAADASARDDLARRLSSSYRVIDRVMPGASATIVVGEGLPAAAADVVAPAFAVLPAPRDPSVAITAIDVPRETPFASRAPVEVSVRVRQGSGQKVEIALRQGAATIDRVERTVASADDTLHVALDFVPPTRGPVTLTASARLVGTPVSSEADAVTDVTDRPWSVLFFDRQPSWGSTFVRRALERDPRFSVRSRTATSTGIATERGDAPVSLDRRETLDAYDAVVLGAPDSLSASVIGSVERFARQRGGAVVVLLDRPGGATLMRLTRVARWTASMSPAAIAVETPLAGVAPLQATELLALDRLPAGARVLAQASLGGVVRPVVFEVPVGAGRVIASGVVDAWRYRGVPESSTFDRFWQTTIGEAAAAAPPSMRVEPSATLLSPGQITVIAVAIRDVAGVLPATGSLNVRASASGPAASSAGTALRLWPEGMPGHFVAEFRAPDETGVYRVDVESEGARGEAKIVVVGASGRIPKPDESDALTTWVHSRSGQVFAAADSAGLDRALSATLRPEHRSEPWWPMRSAWWIIAFAGALGGEWWLRRRRDLR